MHIVLLMDGIILKINYAHFAWDPLERSQGHLGFPQLHVENQHISPFTSLSDQLSPSNVQ